MKAGDTALVKQGTYAESLIMNVPSGTSWSNVVRIAAYPGHVVTMRPASGQRVLEFGGPQYFIEFDGINLDGTNVAWDTVKINAVSLTANAHHIRIKNAELLGTTTTSGYSFIIICTQLVAGLTGGNEFINLKMHRGGGANDGFSHAFYIQSSNNLVEYNTIYDVRGNGVQIYNGQVSNVAHNNTVRYNIIRDLNSPGGRRGVVVGDGTGNKVYGNLIYNITGTEWFTAGIHSYAGSGTEIYNNTIVNSSSNGILVEAGNTIVRNNIAYGNPTNYSNMNGTTAQDHNLFGTDPKFMNVSTRDFRLSDGSPAINSGLAVTMVQTDINGVTRPQGGTYDLGAYEAMTGQSTSAPPAPPSNVRLVQN